MEIKVSDIVRAYRRNQKVTLREFADQLTSSIKVEITFASVSNWENGSSLPSTDLLLQILIAHDDWRQAFALECLRAKLPEVFADNKLTLIRALGGTI
jgi:transcriptional regulator with XRE-family HTH domain